MRMRKIFSSNFVCLATAHALSYFYETILRRKTELCRCGVWKPILVGFYRFIVPVRFDGKELVKPGKNVPKCFRRSENVRKYFKMLLNVLE